MGKTRYSEENVAGEGGGGKSPISPTRENLAAKTFWAVNFDVEGTYDHLL